MICVVFWPCEKLVQGVTSCGVTPFQRHCIVSGIFDLLNVVCKQKIYYRNASIDVGGRLK